MADPSNAVVKQWDPALTTFSTVDRLRGLVVATTKDDVQLSAVLAIERLGARLIVAPKLISDGVDALKGNESVRLADARLLLGLSWGGVAAHMRLSTACVRAFLLISALKICAYDDWGIAEIIYEYLSSAKLLDMDPVSVRQLSGLLDAMSGYSNTLLHSVQVTMDEIIQSMANLGPESWPRYCFEAIHVKHIADMFLRCFEAIQQVEGGYIEISGQQGLIWIATVLLWLNPDEVGLFSQDRLLLGTAGGKVRIIMDTALCLPVYDTSRWIIRTWKAGKSITTMISEDILPEWARPRRTRHKVATRNVRHYVLGESHVEAQIESTDLVGALAAGLIDAALLFGTVVVSRNGRQDVVRLGLLYDETFLQNGGCVMKGYGWDLEYIRANATEFLARFPDSVKIPIPSTTNFMYMVVRILKSFVMDVPNNLRRKLDDPEAFEVVVFNIAATAVRLAGHALASAHVNFGTLVQFYYPGLASDWISELYSNMQLERFLEQIYKAVGMDLNGLPEPSLTALIRSSEGRVVIPQVMLDHSTRRDSLFKLVVIPGRIHFEGSYFNAVVGVETGFWDWTGAPYEAPRRVPIFDQNTRRSVLLVPVERNMVTLKYFFATDQRLLLMKTCISSDQDGSTIEVDYPECLRNLAVAFHATPSKNTLGLRDNPKELSLSRFNDIMLIRCLTNHWGLIRHKVLQIFVTHVPNSQELRFFASHTIFQPQSCALCILQGAEIVEVLYGMMIGDGLAPSIDKSWRIITGNDR